MRKTLACPFSRKATRNSRFKCRVRLKKNDKVVQLVAMERCKPTVSIWQDIVFIAQNNILMCRQRNCYDCYDCYAIYRSYVLQAQRIYEMKLL